MLNLIRAEWYKYSKRPYMYILSGILSILCVGGIYTLKGFSSTAQVDRMFAIDLAGGAFGVILAAVLLFSVVFTEEYKESTFKNIVISNVSRTKIFIGKFIVQLMLASLVATISLVVFVISLNMLSPGEGYSLVVVQDFLLRFLCAVPLFAGGIAVGNLLIVLLKKEGIMCAVYYFGFIVGQDILLSLMSKFPEPIKIILNVLPSLQLHKIATADATKHQMLMAVLIGLGHIVVFTVLGERIYSKQEIK